MSTNATQEAKDAKLARSVEKLNRLRAAMAERKAAERQAKDQAIMSWRFERTWDAGTSIEAAASQFNGDGTVHVFDFDGQQAGSQMRLRDDHRHHGTPQRFFVRLEDGRLASTTCVVPRFRPAATLECLAQEALDAAQKAVDRQALKQPRLRDEDGAAVVWWLRD
jgi:hypothetical protein